MKVHIEPKFVNRGVDIYIIDSFKPGFNVIYTWAGSGWGTETIPEGRELPNPSLSMPMEMLEELVRAAEGHVHAQDATTRHLDDATGTRDRLLTMIEKRGLR